MPPAEFKQTVPGSQRLQTYARLTLHGHRDRHPSEMTEDNKPRSSYVVHCPIYSFILIRTAAS